ncbi:MAG: pre-peptidase C-terminal domain-containing protein [Phycisphaerales bacterium]|nr:pre-peptidase C-terminal domain-containing protein [Phycisphaerales bacterium]
MNRRVKLLSTTWLLLPIVLVAGCPTTTDKPIDTSNNSSIDTAVALDLSDGTATLTSSRLTSTDVDFFELGALSAGDRVIVDVQTASGNLDPVAAIFDADLNIFTLNDDRTPDSNFNPLIDAVIREAGTYYVAVSAFAGTATSGTYKLTVTLQLNSGVVEPEGQVVFFDWAGGSGITIPNVGTFDLPRFDAAQVGLASSQTAALKTLVEAIVINSYAGYDITFRSSDRDARPGAPHTTIYFGSFNRQAFAISEQVDMLNADPADDAIIFTESFNGAFSTAPSLDQMALAMGNTTAHEIGHLLGLVHTAQASDLMDTTGGNNSILVPQKFETAPIDDSVFPTGFQDSVQLLGWILGLAL